MIKWNRFIRNTAGALALAMAITSMAAGSGMSAYADFEGKVKPDLLNMRSGPSTDDSVINILSQGTTVTVIGTEGQWYKISVNGTTGYVLATYITAGDDSTGSVVGSTGTVNTGVLNVRSGAGTSNSSYGFIYSGSQVSIVGTETVGSELWYKVNVTVNGSAKTGYVLSDYIRVGSSSAGSAEDNTNQDTSNDSAVVAPAGKTGVCDVSALNIRSEANTSCTIKGVLRSGNKFEIIETVGGWYKIKATVNGKTVEGYVYAEHTKLTDDTTTGDTSSDTTTGDTSSDNTQTTTPTSGKIDTGNGSTPLNVRKTASMSGTILGSAANGSKVTILAKEGKWYKVKVTVRGSEVTGYVYATYVNTGAGADDDTSSDNSGDKEVNEIVWATTGVNIRKGPGTNHETIGGLTKNASITRTKILANGWSKVKYGNAEAYICSDYLTTTNPNPTEVTGEAVAQYALQFEGNPYVYGGNDLYNGVDCSGFTKLIYQKFGISINRIADAQRRNGIQVTGGIENAKPGDLVFYGDNGYASHVALYIGNGKVIHASAPGVGIIISTATYRTPMQINRLIY